MAWAEKTIFDVDGVTRDKNTTSDERINRMLKDLPPFMKLTSRRARKVLVRYEDMKQQHIETLRNNHVYKFVMKVAGFTNENIEKYWKGADISPFVERYTPKDIKIVKEDLDLLLLRARENALADLHQFCTEIDAIPMYRLAIRERMTTDKDERVNIPHETPLKEKDPYGEPQGHPSYDKEIYNMSDAEFNMFCKKFLLMRKTPEKAYSSNHIDWYILNENILPQDIPEVYKHNDIFDLDGEQIDSYDAPSEVNSVNNIWAWHDNTPVVHWDATTAEFWFQRFVAKWLAKNPNGDKRDKHPDVELFRDRFRRLFNNLRLDKDTGKWKRDLTGLRLTKMIRGRTAFRGVNDGVRVTDFNVAETAEGGDDMVRPQDMPTEVPLEFAKPLFNERFAHWKHELVLGEYEKRSMQAADKWLQMTPWAIGKIYLQPSIYAHMQEAHIAITKKYKKFEHRTLEDWLADEESSFFLSKLVALCIRTSAVLSGKKYGLDKTYMRLNLEKRRIMHAIGKLEPPRRVRQVSTRPPTIEQERLIRDWAEARQRGDAAAAAQIQARMQRN